VTITLIINRAKTESCELTSSGDKLLHAKFQNFHKKCDFFLEYVCVVKNGPK